MRHVRSLHSYTSYTLVACSIRIQQSSEKEMDSEMDQNSSGASIDQEVRVVPEPPPAGSTHSSSHLVSELGKVACRKKTRCSDCDSGSEADDPALRVVPESPPASSSSDLNLDVIDVWPVGVPLTRLVACCFCCVLIGNLASLQGHEEHTREADPSVPDGQKHSTGIGLPLV